VRTYRSLATDRALTAVEDVTAIFSARHASLIRWPLEQIIEGLAGKPTGAVSMSNGTEALTSKELDAVAHVTDGSGGGV
jgi:hypothetical protein